MTEHRYRTIADQLECEIERLNVGSAVTLVVDPVDGSANAAAGVPLACFSAAVVVDGEFTEAMTSWLHTDERWWASRTGSPYLPLIG